MADWWRGTAYDQGPEETTAGGDLLAQRLAALPEEQRTALQARIDALSPDDRWKLERTLEAQQRGTDPQNAAALAELEQTRIPGIAGADNPIANKIATGMGVAAGVAGPVAGIGGALTSGGIRAALPITGHMAKRAAVGAGLGGVMGSTNLPLVGGMGPLKGAEWGALLGAGQGGSGALWQFGKRKAIFKSLLDKLVGGADEAAGGRVGGAAAGAAEARLSSMPEHIARQIEQERVLEAARRLAARGGRSQRTARVGQDVVEAFVGEQPQLTSQQIAAAEAASAARAARATQRTPVPLGGPPRVAAEPVPIARQVETARAVQPAAAPPAQWPPLSARMAEGASRRGGWKALNAALEAAGDIPGRSSFGSPIGSYDPSRVAAGTGPLSPLVLKIRQAMSMPGGREAVMEWLKTQPPQIVEEVQALLSKGAASMPTTF